MAENQKAPIASLAWVRRPTVAVNRKAMPSGATWAQCPECRGKSFGLYYMPGGEEVLAMCGGCATAWRTELVAPTEPAAPPAADQARAIVHFAAPRPDQMPGEDEPVCDNDELEAIEPTRPGPIGGSSATPAGSN